jgi:hypothetical protein
VGEWGNEESAALAAAAVQSQCIGAGIGKHMCKAGGSKASPVLRSPAAPVERRDRQTIPWPSAGGAVYPMARDL